MVSVGKVNIPDMDGTGSGNQTNLQLSNFGSGDTAPHFTNPMTKMVFPYSAYGWFQVFGGGGCCFNKRLSEDLIDILLMEESNSPVDMFIQT